MPGGESREANVSAYLWIHECCRQLSCPNLHLSHCEVGVPLGPRLDFQGVQQSLGSRSEPMTVSHGTPSASAAAWIRADLPVPGSHHRQTATPARPAAWSTVTM